MKKVCLVLITLATLFMSIGYASINSVTLDVKGNITATVQDGIFITEVTYNSNVSADLTNSKINSFAKGVLNNKVVLSTTDGNSSITYKVVIYNNTSDIYRFKDATYDSSFYDNENIIYTLTNIDTTTLLNPKSSVEFYITFSYKDNTVTTSNILNSYISFNFKINQSKMENTLVNKYVPSGNSDDIDTIDLDSMTTTEKTNKYGNVSTSKEINKIKGISGETVIALRGNYTDNYVSFANLVWRILQIDENGNLRLVLNAPISNTTAMFQSSSSISSLDNAKVQLSYTNSSVKTAIDSWYTNNLSSYQDKIIKSKFCINFDSYTKSSTGAGNQVNYFQSYENIGSDSKNYNPNLVCPSAYLIEDNIGLLSAEEIVVAGGSYEKSNTSYFLYNSSITSYYWTLSPAYYDSTQNNGNVFIVGSDGKLTDWTSGLIANNYYLRPVITIDGNLEMTGSGTSSDPFKYS